MLRPTVALALVLATMAALPATAQIPMTGASAGLRSEPGDAFVLGAHARLWQPQPAVRVVTTGSLALGRAERFTVTPELHFVATQAPVADLTYFYVGGGPDLTMTMGGGGGTSTGLTMLAGLEWVGAPEVRFFGELRVHNFGPTDWFEVGLGVSTGLIR